MPVLSRLTVGWLALVGGAASLTAAAIWSERPAISLRVASAPETLAPPIIPPVTRSVFDAERIAAPDLREGDGEISAGDGGAIVPDLFDLAPSDGAYGDDYSALEGEVTITIDGAPARAPGEALREEPEAFAPPVAIRGPDPALLVETPFGKRPRIGADGRRAADVYARPFTPAGAGPKAALIMGGLGLNAALTARAIETLPAEVTLAFAPYAKDLDKWTARARAAGHEIMVEIPMETGGPNGASEATIGPAGLATRHAAAANLQRLDWLLSRFGAYCAATNYLGVKFSSDRSAMAPVMARLADAGVAYVDDTGLAPGANGLARIIAADSALDAARTLDEGFGALTRDAVSHGAAIGKTYATQAGIDAAQRWARDLAEREVALAPASALLSR